MYCNKGFSLYIQAQLILIRAVGSPVNPDYSISDFRYLATIYFGYPVKVPPLIQIFSNLAISRVAIP